MAKTEQQLEEALEDNKKLTEQLVEKGKLLVEANEQIEELNADIEREKLYAEELCKKVIELSDELAVFSIKEIKSHCNGGGMCGSSGSAVSDSDSQTSNEDIELQLRKGSLTPICDLMLSCTLCGEKLRMEELEPHSSRCSSGNGRRGSGKEPSTPTLPGMLVATVTTSRRESMIVGGHCSLFKVICKTTIPEFKKTLLVAERTTDDFVWFRSTLEKFHPENIIPPLQFKEDLTGNLREAQRFLSRVCVHNALKYSSITRKFFDASPKELEKVVKAFQRKISPRLKCQKPAVEVVDKDGLLFRTQTYMSQLMNNLDMLVRYFKENQERRTSDGLSECFLALSYGETNETYLQTVAKALSNIIGGLENKRDVSFVTYGLYDESVLAEDLESILEYVRAVNELLTRVESSINTYLYWEEEIRVFEELKMEGLVTQTNGKSITQLWAEASSNSRTAKNELEDMCRDLSEELVSFDMRKEHEMKQIFIEYAESRYDVFETMQSKWFGVKLMLKSDISPDVRSIDLTST